MVRGRKTGDDLDRELQAHLELEAGEQRENGLARGDARYAAERALGNRTRIREEVRELSRWASVDAFAQDLRYGLRMLRKHPGFTFVAAMTLALGVGANTAVFSVVEAVLLRPLPYPHADHLAMVWEDVNLPAYKNARNTPSPGNFSDWQTQTTGFSGMSAIGYRAWNLTGDGDPIRLVGEAVSANLFGLLGVDAAIGRTFTDDEDQPDASKVVILAHGLWVDRFGGDPAILGQTIRLDEVPYTVVGVMPPGFAFPDPDDRLWTPIALTREQRANHGSHFLRVIARLKPQVTLTHAQAELDAVATRLAAQYPHSNTGVGVRLVPLREQTVGDVQTPLLLLIALVGLVLLMVCANISGLLLARASARERELAVRVALGAGRSRLLRQLLTESTLLSLLGGAAGLALAAWGITGLRWLAPASLPQATDLSLNLPVGLFNFGVASVAGFLSGIVPAWQQADQGQLYDTLKGDARASSRRPGSRLRSFLVVVETALGVVVLVGAGLLLRSFWQLEHVTLGFQPDRVLTFRVAIPDARYGTMEKRTAFYRRIADGLGSSSGVQAAAGISFLPLTLSGRSAGIAVEGDPPVLPGDVKFVDFRSVTPGYFSTLGIPVIAGRDLLWSDTANATGVVVISQTAARTFWPDRDPIGRRIKLGGADDRSKPWLTVVGIVGNVQQLDLVRRPRPAIYLAGSQDSGTGDIVRDWAVRGALDPLGLAPTVRAVVRAVDPTLPITRLQTLDGVHSAALAREQFTLLLVALFAVLALALAAVGLYGLIAFTVAQRTRELGIRLALGATSSDVLRLVVALGGRLALAGVAIGMAASFGLSRLMSTMLFGISSHDPITFVGVAVLLVAVSLIACYAPARRATRVNPTDALRT